MAEFAARIETLEHALMRAWIQRDAKAMKKLCRRDLMFVIGAKKTMLLDRPSWIEASAGRWTAGGYRFRDIRVGRHGGAAIFSASLDLEMRLDRADWNGRFFLSDLWIRSTVTRGWHLAERSLSRIDEEDDVPPAIRKLQLWR